MQAANWGPNLVVRGSISQSKLSTTTYICREGDAYHQGEGNMPEFEPWNPIAGEGGEPMIDPEVFP